MEDDLSFLPVDYLRRAIGAGFDRGRTAKSADEKNKAIQEIITALTLPYLEVSIKLNINENSKIS